MVRKRGVARRSYGHRRVRRVKKYDHNVIPRRFKIQLPDLADRLKPPLDIHVECEEPTMELLDSLGVASDEQQYYLGFMKRMVELYLKFTAKTLQKEKDSLIGEYVLRGKDKDVLQQVQIQAEICLGVRVPQLEEKDFSSYAQYDRFVDTDVANNTYAQTALFNTDETKILLIDAGNSTVKVYDIASKTLSAVIIDKCEFPSQVQSTPLQNFSAYGKYVGLLWATDWTLPNCNRMTIIKDGTILQTFTSAQLGIVTTNIRSVQISPTGKYVIVSGYLTPEDDVGWVVLEGS